MQPKFKYSHWLFKVPGMGSWYGITLWPYILFAQPSDKVSKRLREHELAHWEQVERDGFFTFYVKYLWYQFKYGYINNPYEVEAREKARERAA